MAIIGVIGADVPGLVAASELKACGHTVRVFAMTQAAESIVLPGFKFLDRTTEVEQVLQRLGVLYQTYPINVGLMRHGDVDHLRKRFSPEVYFAHYRKTRLTLPPEVAPSSIDDPESGSRRHGITLDWELLVTTLLREVGLTRVNSFFNSAIQSCDGFVVAVPLWEVGNLFPKADIPDAMATKLQFVCVDTTRDPYAKWDVVYTPYTPGSLVYRLYHHDQCDYVCEFSGELNEDALQSDLNFLFPDGWYLAAPVTATNGHLLPLTHAPVWPRNVIAVGKHATWDSRNSFTNIIRDVRAFAKVMNGNA